MATRTYTCPRCGVGFDLAGDTPATDAMLCPSCTMIVHNFRSCVEDARRPLTRSEASRRTGIPLDTLDSWESGKRAPRLYARDGILRQLREAAAR